MRKFKLSWSKGWKAISIDSDFNSIVVEGPNPTKAGYMPRRKIKVNEELRSALIKAYRMGAFSVESEIKRALNIS